MSMEDNMAEHGCRKKEKVSENPRRTYTLAQIRLEKRIKRVMSEIRGADGKPPSRAFERILYDEQKPVGMLGRRLAEARAKKTPLDQAERILDEVRDWLRKDLYGGGEQRTA